MTKSTNAAKLGFKTSWMQYLMENKKCYRLTPLIKKYNPKFITVLTENYRSHPDILAVPNKCFYDKMLQAKGNQGTYIHYLFVIS